ncbi:hypothetical protein XU18_3480 [Perkinsela sp. CCAP 1560/4]|nr:hypothetical protein XU18_3480 [Perkinsela sp. CCAP 1560/4]|eukprot:KNH05509.1 hypothetical protein XU18_3480 [Perkinsela sp. CCAP 1560/4]
MLDVAARFKGCYTYQARKGLDMCFFCRGKIKRVEMSAFQNGMKFLILYVFPRKRILARFCVFQLTALSTVLPMYTAVSFACADDGVGRFDRSICLHSKG